VEMQIEEKNHLENHVESIYRLYHDQKEIPQISAKSVGPWD